MIKKIESYQDMISRLFPPTPEQLAKRGEEKVATKNVTFQVTDDCNLYCSYCYQICKQHHSMPFEVAKAFIDMLLDDDEQTSKYIDSKNSDALIIEFIGGEPFMEIDLIDKITDYFIEQMIEKNHPWQYRYMISICSNGLLYFDPKVQAYIKKHFHHLSFSITIDGNKKLHDTCRVQKDGSGSYDIAIAGVRHFVDVLGGQMGSKMTIAPENVQYTFEAVKSIVEEGYTDINLNCVYEEGWTTEHAKILYDQLKQVADYIVYEGLFDKVSLSIFQDNFFKPKDPNDIQNWCGGSGAMISVDWKGDIYPCIRYMESSLGPDIKPIIVGNVWEGILTRPEWQEDYDCLHCTTRRSSCTDECFDCPIAEGCSDCTAYNYQVHGLPIKRATFICIMHKARCLANCYFWNLAYIAQGENKRFKLWLPDEDCLEIISQEELDILHAMEQ